MEIEMIRTILQWLVPLVVGFFIIPWCAWKMQNRNSERVSLGGIVMVFCGLYVLAIYSIIIISGIVSFFIWLY